MVALPCKILLQMTFFIGIWHFPINAKNGIGEFQLYFSQHTQYGTSMPSLLQRLFTRSATPTAEEQRADFAARFHRFKLFMGEFFEASSELMRFEERLGNPQPISMPYLRSCTAKLTINTLQCIMQLNALSHDKHAELSQSLESIMQEMQETLLEGMCPIDGAYTIPLADVNQSHHELIATSLCNLGELWKTHPHLCQKGFVLTGSAWWQHIDRQDMHDELDRIMVISQDEPGSFSAAATRIQEVVRTSYPIPDDIRQEVSRALDAIRDELNNPNKVISLRCLAVKPEHGAITVASLLVRTPCTDEDIFTALSTSFARVYQARVILYRLKLGIRDRAMPFCWTLTVLPHNHARGSAHMGFGENNQKVQVHYRRNFSDDTGYGEDNFFDVSASLHQKIQETCHAALITLFEETGLQHEIFWVSDKEGNVEISNAGPIYQPNPESMRYASEVASPYNNENYVHRIEGEGMCSFPGIVHGEAYPVHTIEDALFFPIGDILLVEKAAPTWSFLLDFAKGAVASDGTDQSLFSRTSRRYGKPTIINLPQAVNAFSNDESICVAAAAENPCVMGCDDHHCPAPTNISPCIDQEGCYPRKHSTPNGLCWLDESDIGNITRKLFPLLMSSTLPESDHVDFCPGGCQSYTDILNFAYNMTVREMFSYSTSRKTSDVPAKQLVCDVPMQFWIINLADGFKETVKGPTVHLEDIISPAMLAFWDGFVSKPWDGPPQINAKGLMSIFFEATVNPNLDPAVQSTHYTEKNMFLISERYLSARCRFGFHFLSLDCLIGERERERFIMFQFTGGAASLNRRIRRVKFVADLLEQFNFTCEIKEDALSARLEQGTEEAFLTALRILGYLFMHTRQLDMIMGDEAALAERREVMLTDMQTLARGELIGTPGE